MPNNGRIIEWDALELRVGGSVSCTGSGAGTANVYGFSVAGNTLYADNAYYSSVGIALSAEASFDGTTASWEVFYDGPGGPFTASGTGSTSCSIAAVIKDLQIYSILSGALYRVVWSAIDLYVNGAFHSTLSGSGIDTSSAGVGPNYIPIIGVPLSLSGSCSGSRIGIEPFEFDACAPDEFEPQSFEVAATGSASGGWRFKEKGSEDWQSLPIAIQVVDAPGNGVCPFELTAEDVISGSNTGSVSIAMESYTKKDFTYEGRSWVQYPRCKYVCDGEIYDAGFGSIVCYDQCTGDPMSFYSPHVYKTRIRTRSQSGSIRIVPNLPKSIKRHSLSGFATFWLRLALPGVTGSAGRTCTDGATTVSTSSAPSVFPSMAELLGIAGDSVSTVEEPFEFDTICPISVGKSETDITTFDTSNLGYQLPPLPGCEITCPDLSDPNCDYIAGGFYSDPLPVEDLQESVSYSFPATVGDEGSYQWHGEALLRYLGTWGAVHWHLLQWNENWASIAAVDYWKPGRQQWLNNSAASISRNTRTDLIGSCCEESGHTPFLDSFVAGLRWIGAGRWRAYTPDTPSELSTGADADDRIDFGEEGSGSVDGSGITLDVGTVQFELDLLSFNSAPYLYALICDRVRFNTGAVNISSFTVDLVGVDGTAKRLAEATGTFDFVKGKTSKYAGSWAIDNGIGIGVVDDEGEDSQPSGISAAAMADESQILGFQMLPSTAAAKLRITVIPTDDEEPCVFPHPTFIASSETPTIVFESAQISALLWPDGQMIRLGNFVFFDGSTLQNPPLISGAGYKQTIIDALCQIRLIFEGRAHDDGLTTELTELFDSYEGQAVSVVDKFSISYPLPGDDLKFALVNCQGETPPLNCFPNRAFDESTWEKTGDFALEVWDWTQEPRKYIAAGSIPMHLFDSAETQWTLTESAPSGWAISTHSHAVTNLEDDGDFTLKRGAFELATVAPWRGFSAVFGQPGKGRPSMDVCAEGTWARATVSVEGFVITGKMRRSESWQDSETEIEADSVCIRWDKSDRQGRAFLLVGKDGEGELFESKDIAGWQSTGHTMTGELPSFFFTDDGLRFEFWQDGDAIKMQRYDKQNNSIGSVISVVTGVDENSGVAADYDTISRGVRKFGALVVIDGELELTTSTDGVSWS